LGKEGFDKDIVTSQLDSSLWETWRAALNTLLLLLVLMVMFLDVLAIQWMLRILSCWPGMLIDIRACLLILIVHTAPHFCFDCSWSKQGQSVDSLAPLLEIVCDVVRWLLSADFPLTISNIRIIQNVFFFFNSNLYVCIIWYHHLCLSFTGNCLRCCSLTTKCLGLDFRFVFHKKGYVLIYTEMASWRFWEGIRVREIDILN
jgi:hypothetical protein